MLKIKTLLNALIARLSAFYPERLPESPEAHKRWAGAIIALGGFPDNDSFRHALSTMVLHVPAGTYRKSKAAFINELKRSIANQTAYQIMQECKPKNEKQEANSNAV